MPPVSLTRPAEWLKRADGGRLAFRRVAADSPEGRPGLVFLTGYMSDMTSGKAETVETLAVRRGLAGLRFDYRGHGESSGAFEDFTLGDWLQDALMVIDRLTAGPQILIGSSMGGWVAVLAALARPQRVAGLVTLAAAIDMTEDVIRPQLDADALAALARDGRAQRPSPYGEDPFVITARFLEEARAHLLGDGPVGLTCPARLMHGLADPDIPWQQSLKLAERLESRDVRLALIKDGGHRLSEPADLQLLCDQIDDLCHTLAGQDS